MAIIKRPFQADGFVLSGPAAPTSSGDITDIETGLVADENGNLAFRDNFVTQILNKDSITLKELYNRVNGVFTELNSEGKSQLFFKDETVSRPYSLNEIVSACANWRKNMTNGSLWWLGRTEIDHSRCSNLPRINDKLGANVLWSVDRFLSELNNLTQCDTVDPVSFADLTVDPDTGEPKWWDVQNLEIVLPPTDSHKASMIMAKLAYQSYNSSEPIMFRIYDATAGVELARTSSVNANAGRIMYPIPLTYFGPMPTLDNRSSFTSSNSNFVAGRTVDCEEDCGCSDVTCVEGDPYCVVSTGENVETIFEQGSHLIKIQFRVINYHPDHWERVFGAEQPEDGVLGDPEYLTNSAIDALVFNVSPEGRFSRQHGTATLINQSEVQIVLDTPYASTDYSISLSCDQNVNVWYTNKTGTGFTIMSELPFSGNIDWIVMNEGVQ